MIVEVEGLSKRYGKRHALREVDLKIEPGGVVGLLGPNGAGKTTLVEILEGLRSPTAGRVTVLGLDPICESRRLKQRIGVQLQSTALPEDLTPIETLRVFAAFFSKSLPEKEVLTRVGIAEKATEVTNRKLSGGERQRLAIAIALINDPEFVILDEPTAGLDPGARREMHDHIAGLRAAKRTVLLTTHYLDEAEKLCDRVIILREGKVVADGSPATLISRASSAETLAIALKGDFDPAPLLAIGAEHQGADGLVSRFAFPDARSAIIALGQLLRNSDVCVIDLRMDRPNLEGFYHELMAEGEPNEGR